METLLKCIHIFASLFLILVVLLQSGRGGGVGAAFGGAGGQIFGGRGAGNFLSRVTSGAAVMFFLTSLTLSMLSSRHRSVFADGPQPSETETEAAAPDAGAKQNQADTPAETEPPAPRTATPPSGTAKD